MSNARNLARLLPNASGQLPDAAMASGSVIQVVDSGAMSTVSNSNTTTFIDGNCTATITPTSATSKILIICSQQLQVWNSAPYATGRWKFVRSINGGSFSDIYIDYDTYNGNVFAYDYGGSGINVYRPTAHTMVDTPNTTSPCVYKTQIALGSNGGNRISANSASPGRMILMEISA